jgi:hypothetical protein
MDRNAEILCLIIKKIFFAVPTLFYLIALSTPKSLGVFIDGIYFGKISTMKRTWPVAFKYFE